MTEVERIAAELGDSVHGDPWYGASVLSLLDDVDASVAGSHSSGARHSVWEIVLHMTGWAGETARRLRGGDRREPPRGNWPLVTTTNEAAWRADISDFLDAHDEVAQAILALGDADLDAVSCEGVDSLGRPVTFHRMAVGLAQHVAYHAGQIAIIKQTLRAASDSA